MDHDAGGLVDHDDGIVGVDDRDGYGGVGSQAVVADVGEVDLDDVPLLDPPAPHQHGLAGQTDAPGSHQIGLIAYGAALLLAFFLPLVALVVYGALAIFYALPGPHRSH